MNPLDASTYLPTDASGILDGDVPCDDDRGIPLVGSWKALSERWQEPHPQPDESMWQLSGKLIRPYLPFGKTAGELRLDDGQTRVEHRNEVTADAGGDSVSVLVLADMHRSADGYRPISSGGDMAGSKAFVERIIAQEDHDLLFLAGDMTDTGHASAFKAVAEEVSGDTADKLAIPGNHDRQFRGAETAGLLGIHPASSETVEREVSDITGQEPGFPSVTRHQVGSQGLVVVGLDSCRRPASSIVDNAIGEVTSEQLDTAAEKLGRIRQPGDAVMLGLHHHLKGGPALLRLLDADKVLDFIESEKIDAVVSGHNHSPYITHHGSAAVVSCGSAYGHAEGPLAKEVGGPSAYLLTFGSEGLREARLLQDGMSEYRQEHSHNASSEALDHEASGHSGAAA